jgi:hypothetical protein
MHSTSMFHGRSYQPIVLQIYDLGTRPTFPYALRSYLTSSLEEWWIYEKVGLITSLSPNCRRQQSSMMRVFAIMSSSLIDV